MHYRRWRIHGTVGNPGASIRPAGQAEFVSNQGYVIVTHSESGNHRGRALQHRLAMEQLLGRELHDFENVHHKNGVRHDNRPENLELWTKPQPSGQRPEDLVDWVVQQYPELVAAALEGKSQLRLLA